VPPSSRPPTPPRPRRAGSALVEALVAVVLAAVAALPVVALVARAVPATHDAARERRLARLHDDVHGALAAPGCAGAPHTGDARTRDGTVTWRVERTGASRVSEVEVRSVRGAVRRTMRSVACD
jgi:hypothetical protein